jgi:hypothetical protein
MRKSIFVLVFAMLTSVAFAQLSFGPKIGVNISKLSTDFDTITSTISESAKAGFQIGAFVRFGTKTYIQPELLYSVRGGTTTFVNTAKDLVQGNYKMSTMDIPVLVGVKALSLPLVKVRAYAGPVASFIMSKELTVNGVKESIDDIKLKNAIWSATVGAGVDVLMFTVDLRYEIGLNNISDITGTTMKNNVFNVSVGWKIL